MPPTDRVPTWVLAVLGMAFVAFAGGRYGVEAIVWVANVPFLLWLRRTRHVGQALLVLVALIVGTTVQIGTIVTDPIPWAFAPAYSLPMAVGAWVALLSAEHLRRRTSDRTFIFGMAALAAVFDVSSAGSPTGAWGSTSGSLSDSLALLQITSVFGIGAIGFLVGAVQAWLTTVLASGTPRRYLPDGAVVIGLVLATLAFGSWRLTQLPTGPTVSVAAVVTHEGFTPATLPSPEALATTTADLFARSARAADRGARLIVWNEGATAVDAAREPALLERGAAFARDHGVDLVLAYIVVTARDPIAFENQATFIDHTGAVRVEYHKRHPVPGETTPSDNPAPAIERDYGIVSIGICYDHDFPEMSLQHAAAGAGIVAVPSSDWAGIDPIHTRMARVRAIEGGFSSLRAVRWAASAGFDAHGRVRGWMPAGEANDGILLVDLPTTPVATLYARWGELPMVLPLLAVLGWIGLAIRRRGL